MPGPVSKRAVIPALRVLSCLVLATSVGVSQSPNPPSHPLSTQAQAIQTAKGPYFGLSLPGETPVLFAPEILGALSPFVEATAFSPDGTELFVGVGDATYSGAKLYYSKCIDGTWAPFEDAPFTSGFIYSHEVVFSEDGSSLTFTGKKANRELDFWTVSRTDRGWGTPTMLPSPINSEASEFRGSRMTTGTLYFGSSRTGMNQIYKATSDAAQVVVVELLGPPINKEYYDGDPCIAPDGRFLVFYSARRAQNTNLYVSFPDAQGGWGTPINLGPDFNTGRDEYGAHLSSDGKIMFFTRHYGHKNEIYWVATSAIDKLNPRNQPKP